MGNYFNGEFLNGLINLFFIFIYLFFSFVYRLYIFFECIFKGIFWNGGSFCMSFFEGIYFFNGQFMNEEFLDWAIYEWSIFLDWAIFEWSIFFGLGNF